MTEELIRQIASEIVNESIIKNWYFYVLFLTVGFLGSYGGSYVKGYASEKSKNKAISSDLEDIKKQLKETTKITEQIKTDIEHSMWRKKAIEAVKREKLEEYFTFIYSGKEALHDQMLVAFFRDERSVDRHALNKADIIQKLYFPELVEAHQEFRMATSSYLSWIAAGQSYVAAQMKLGKVHPTPTDEHMALQEDIQNTINYTAALLSEAGKDYADRLNA